MKSDGNTAREDNLQGKKNGADDVIRFDCIGDVNAFAGRYGFVPAGALNEEELANFLRSEHLDLIPLDNGKYGIEPV